MYVLVPKVTMDRIRQKYKPYELKKVSVVVREMDIE